LEGGDVEQIGDQFIILLIF
jgi:hypothetical protein